ncbi:uncharacterized protein I303_101356 [Kwoniella dejecticola CBS 10117]|uniref:Rho guanyl-nucleotide exchange factor n=1 Tax=Kwoniella dejecticola CBS 10117 TaxID=1296121 RepID=A0A1A6AHP8_9TREE|nr:uncharacterized protein I303_01366 [Kwoniella dejecticola CBS 10117]OBR89538.1 hypothetical protein I303_01366 [Kwoniella dejecticola CBS 10117]
MSHLPPTPPYSSSSQPPRSPADSNRRHGFVNPSLPSNTTGQALYESDVPGSSNYYPSAPSSPRLPSGGLNEFGYTEQARPITPSGSVGRRPLPAQPPVPAPALPPNPYPSYRSTSGSGSGFGATGSVGRRALPTPPSQSGSSATTLPPPRPSGARALPSVPGGSRGRTVSGPAPSYPEGDPPPPPPRPSQPYASSSYVPAPLPPPPRTSTQLTPPLPRPPTDRVNHLADEDRNIFMSPSSSSSSSNSFASPSPSRAPSQSHSTAHSSTTFSSSSASVTRNSSRSTQASSLDTRPTSVSSDHDSWLPILPERFGDLGMVEEYSGGRESVDGLAPPSISGGASSGRGTPTQKDWFDGPPSLPYLEDGRTFSRNRAASAATIGPDGEAYPITPKGDDKKFDRQGGILGAPFQPDPPSPSRRSTNNVSFPVPQIQSDGSAGPADEEGTWSSNETVPAPIRREDSISSNATDYSITANDSDAQSLSALNPASSSSTTNLLQQISNSGNSGNIPQRQSSITSSLHPASISSRHTGRSVASALSPSWAAQTQQPSNWVSRKLQIHQSHRSPFEDEETGEPRLYEDDNWDDEDEEEDEEELDVNEIRFFQPAFVSEMALQLRDKVERGRHIKAGIAWVGSFTGKDIVTTIQNLLPPHTRSSGNDRRFAHATALSLQNQLWFVEVDWDIKPLRDSSDDVFRFMGEMEGMGSGGDALTTELPKGLMSMATRCYSPSCTGDKGCYAPRCPFKTNPNTFLEKIDNTITPSLSTPASIRHGDWKDDVDPLLLRDLTEKQMARQAVIHQALQSEEAYLTDLTAMETLFIEGIRDANPPIIRDEYRREMFIHEVFNNALDLKEACKRLIEEFHIRMREQPIIFFVGDLFLQAATEFRNIYPEYTGKLPQAELALSREMEENPEFRLFVERVIRDHDRRRDIKYLITRPSTQLQRYPAVLEGILNATETDDPDKDFLEQALVSIQSLSSLSQLKLFHASKGRGPAGKLQWYDLVPEKDRKDMKAKEQKRQMQIWELIQGEMEYVADLESIETLFVNGLRLADPAVIDRNRLDVFLDEAFHNYRSLLEVHSRLLENLQHRQLEQHPHFGMISDLIFDAALNWQEAYMEYVTHYPIAKAKVQEEESRNPKFAAFLQTCLKDPSANRQDVYHFINRPIPRLLRYNLLLADILKSLKEVGPADHPDIEQIPGVMEVITDLGKATQKGVAVNESKVELWGFQHTLDGSRFWPRMVKDLDLANPMRELIHKGKVYRQPEGSIGGSWTELVVLLFDHYLVLTKPERISRSRGKDHHRQVKYTINRRPIPLELLSLGNFSDLPRQRNTGRLFGVGGSNSDANTEDITTNSTDKDSRTVYPFSISFIGQGQLGGAYTLWADSASARDEWKKQLLHAKVLRLEVNDAGKVFEMIPLSENTFYMAPNYAVPKDKEDQFTGRVTCSCPFTTSDRRKLVAVGCQDGVWIGVRGETASLRKVLHVKNVTNIAVLEEFGMFLVLSDKNLFAYHLEALVPSGNGRNQWKTAPERVTMPREEISYFTVGRLDGRTLVVTMKKDTTTSTFKILEPVLNRSAEDPRQRRPFGFLGKGSEWFRPYKMFYLPAEVYGLHFLKHKMAIVCSKGFEIMNLNDLKGGSIPTFEAAKTRENPRLLEIQKKCETAKPLGMFRSTETEFLLCYDSFGVYVDRHGEPNRDQRPIEWEGKPDSVAFHPPYLLLISAPFIEIRHIDTAKLLQIYTGSDLRLTWDGSGGHRHQPIDNPGKNGYGEETKIQEPQIHICQRAQDQRQLGRHLQGVGQHVFELSPTLLLNNPLMNPFNTHDSNYLPPPPLTTHATPQIRQARPPSIMTTSSAEYAQAPIAAQYGGYPSVNGNNYGYGFRDSGYSGTTTPQPQNQQQAGYGYGQFAPQQQHQQQQQSGYTSSPAYNGNYTNTTNNNQGGFVRRESANSNTTSGYSANSHWSSAGGGGGYGNHSPNLNGHGE